MALYTDMSRERLSKTETPMGPAQPEQPQRGRENTHTLLKSGDAFIQKFTAGQVFQTPDAFRRAPVRLLKDTRGERADWHLTITRRASREKQQWSASVKNRLSIPEGQLHGGIRMRRVISIDALVDLLPPKKKSEPRCSMFVAGRVRPLKNKSLADVASLLGFSHPGRTSGREAGKIATFWAPCWGGLHRPCVSICRIRVPQHSIRESDLGPTWVPFGPNFLSNTCRPRCVSFW